MDRSSGQASGKDDAATVLLGCLPAEQYPIIINNLISTLRPDDQSSINLVDSLVASSANDEVRDAFLSFLLASIKGGHLTCAATICLRRPPLGNELLRSIGDDLSEYTDGSGAISIDRKTIESYLSFARSVAVQSLPVASHTAIFRAAIKLMSSSNDGIAIKARDIVFKTLGSSDLDVVETVVSPAKAQIWAQIEETCTRTDASKSTSTLGYSLWLRWLSSERYSHPSVDMRDIYWQLIVRGLRIGDTERRKVCLVILKLSTAEHPSLSDAFKAQSSRFCTVFETIILGQYMNQVLECKSDLDFLASEESVLPVEWLYVLLAAAIDVRMQHANRKFIGNWVMRTALRPHPEFFAFLQHDFLPWAMQGQVFVATVKTQCGVVHCVHGDRLAAMVERVAQSGHPAQQDEVMPAERIADMIVNRLTSEKSTFAYAIVYLLEGIGKWLTPQHRASIAALSLNGLPRVVRDYILSAIDTSPTNTKVSRSQIMERELLAKAQSLEPTLHSVQEFWSATVFLDSPRDVMIAAPGVIFSPAVMDASSTDAAFRNFLKSTFGGMQKMVQKKTFFLAPLMTSVRRALLSKPNSAQSIPTDELIVAFANHPPQPILDMQLEEAAISMAGLSYEKYLGDRPSIGYAAYFDLISRLGAGNQKTTGAVLAGLLPRWRDQKLPPLTVSAWKTTLQLQVMLLCCEQLQQTTAEADKLLQDLLHILSVEPLPRYRYLLEWMCTRLCLKHSLQDSILRGLASKDHHANPKFLASLMKVGCIVGCAQGSEEFARRLGTTFIPLSASSKVVIRHEAQWQVPILMDYASAQGWKTITDDPTFIALDEYIRSLERFSDPPPERMLGSFDPIKDHTMSNLVEGPWYDFDHFDAPLTSRDDFVTLFSRDDSENSTRPDSCIPLGPPVRTKARIHPTTDDAVDASDSKPPGPRTFEEATALQTKGTAYLARILSDPSSAAARPTDLLVVASLVDNPHNLGGLSRASEVFGAAALTLQNQNVLGNRDFSGVSVSSHLHFPIVQLSARDVPAWLAERRAEGYAAVGIEQTDRSVLLGSPAARLPRRAVLVVGSEREGIPAAVLSECDVLVEIPQRGVTRSLNVQTAVAVVLYEHARQHPGSHVSGEAKQA